MYELYEHQKKASDFIVGMKGRGALFMEIGTGKTLTVLDIFKRLREQEPNLKMLVICPISLINAAWGEDIRKFTDYKYCNIREGVKDADIYIINYESYYIERNQVLINDLGLDMVVLDESSKIRNPRARITKSLLHNRDNFRFRVIMSGTPAPNGYEEYWSQMKFCSPALPDSFYRFRNLYMKLDRNGYSVDYVHPTKLGEMFRKGFKYVLKDNESFMKEIKPYCFWAKKSECLDLPETVDVIRDVVLSPSQMAIYKDMKRHMVAEIGNDIVLANVVLTKYLRLRQITSGFAINQMGEPSDITDNSKVNELVELLEEIGDKQVIIWCQFHREFDMISKHLKSYTTLYSLTKDRDKSIEDFKTGKAQYLLAHPKSGGHGLTFTNCDTMVFFSIDYSFEGIEQARGRIHRPGQVNKCTYIYLLAKDTLDFEIKKALETKQSMQDFVKQNVR
jgi:SNF2 family DNA or RNA helicase